MFRGQEPTLSDGLLEGGITWRGSMLDATVGVIRLTPWAGRGVPTWLR